MKTQLFIPDIYSGLRLCDVNGVGGVIFVSLGPEGDPIRELLFGLQAVEVTQLKYFHIIQS